MTQEAKIITGISVVSGVILLGAVFFLSNGSVTQPAVPPVANQQELLVRDTSIKSTDKKTKVTIVEFADFQCPACANLYPMIEKLRAEYTDTVTIVFRYFPLTSIHKNAEISAEAAAAANKQGKFWEMSKLLYSNQAKWEGEVDPMPQFIAYAKEIALDTVQFEKDVRDRVYKSMILADQNDGITLGINGTPTFFVNGERLSGVPTYEVFKQKIDKQLK